MGLYRELPPATELGEHLDCVWSRAVPPGEPAQTQLVLPDACVDIVWAAGQAPFIAGPDTGPVLAELEPGSLIVGARFRPGLAPALLGHAASDLRDARPPLEALWGSRAARRLELASAAGYADQAHMTRECRRLAGLTPVSLLAGRRPR